MDYLTANKLNGASYGKKGMVKSLNKQLTKRMFVAKQPIKGLKYYAKSMMSITTDYIGSSAWSNGSAIILGRLNVFD